MHRSLSAFVLLGLAACVATTDSENGSSTSALDATPAVTTKTALTGNNTSASNWFRGAYTPAARFDGASLGVVTNGNAPSPSVSAASLAVGAVSKIDTRSLLYPGATTKIFVETQAWFCTRGVTPIPTGLDVDQCGSHIDIGYDANTTAHVEREIADMRSRGISGIIADWGGRANGTGALDVHSTSSNAITTGTLFAVKNVAEASGGAFQFAVMEDQGVKACAATSGCNVSDALLGDIAFANASFFTSPAYYRIDGRPVLFFFSVDTWVAKYGKKIDWSYVRSKAAGNPLFVFENAGGFDHAVTDGAYAWLKTTPIESYPGSDPNGMTGFLPYFYKQAASHPDQLVFGSAYKGFDDYVANGWGDGRRYNGQRCGATWLDTFDAINARYSSTNPLRALQLVTWDDYEEGTELETGIENHAKVTASRNGSVLSWNLAHDASAPSECAGVDVGRTIHHFAVYASTDGESLTLAADNIAASARSIDLSGKIPAGATQLYVYAVGKPQIRNHLSPPVSTSASTSGDGCTGNPVVLEPTANQSVGPAIRLRASAPACIQTLLAYVDGKEVLRVTGSSIDQWVPVTMGTHTVGVNGWAGTATAHVSAPVTFTRTY
jgi:hypothetical protein